MRSSNFKEIRTYGVNPYEPNGITKRVCTAKSVEKHVVDQATGEMMSLKIIPHAFEVPHDPVVFTKLFRTDLVNTIRGLNSPAINLFFLIAERLPPNCDHVCITEDDFLDACEYSPGSKRMYYAAVRQLVDKKIIARTKKSSRGYWVNPNIIFNGDRTKLN